MGTSGRKIYRDPTSMLKENLSQASFKKWDYNYVSVMFYIEICLRLGNGFRGPFKVPPMSLQILIYVSSIHIHIHSCIFSELKHKRFISLTYENPTHLSLSVIMVDFHRAPKLGTDFELCFYFYTFLVLKDT